MRRNTEQKFESVRQANDFLSRQITTLRSEIDTIRHTMQQYGEKNGIISVNDASNVALQKLTRLNGDIGAAQNSFYQKQAAYETILRSNPETVAKGD